jgi:hypothetical protein
VLFGKGSECARRAINRRVANGKHGNHNDSVKYGGESFNSSILDGNDKRGCNDVGAVGILQKTRVVVGNNQADNGKGYNVEQRDAPEDLLDGGGQRFSGIGSFRCSKTDQFSSREGKGCVDEHTTEALEAVVKGSWIAPKFSANVAALRTATDVDDNSQDDEPDNGGNLDNSKDKLGFTISFDAIRC